MSPPRTIIFDNFAKTKTYEIPIGARQSLIIPNFGVQSDTTIQGVKNQAQTLLLQSQRQDTKSKLERLHQEPAELVPTSCYTTGDQLIQEMDK